MPLIYYRSVEGAEAALWKATEETGFFREELRKQGFPLEPALRIRHPEKVHQWYASRYLLCHLFPEAIQGYRENKPYLFNGPEVSFSHSRDCVAVIVSEFPSGIDVQWADPKLEKIAGKFLNLAELDVIPADDLLVKLSIIWSVKEAVFKRFGTEMPFKDIALTAYDPVSDTAMAEALRKGKKSIHRLIVDYIGGMSLAYIVK